MDEGWRSKEYNKTQLLFIKTKAANIQNMWKTKDHEEN